MKKNKKNVSLMLSVVALATASGTALAQNNATPELSLPPGWAADQSIKLAENTPATQAATTSPGSTEQPFSPGWFERQAIVLAQTVAVAQTSAPPATDSDSDDYRFHKNEWDVSAFGVYSDQAGGKWGAGAAGTYYVTERIGVGAVTYWTDTGGTFIDNLAAEGYFRFPVIKIIAPYAVGGVGHQFDRDYWFETIGGGVDFRPFKRFSAFSDIQYRISNNHDKSSGGPILRIGARFPF